MKYTSEDYRMYVAWDNASNFMVLDSKKESRYLVFNWDLSDEEIAAIAEKFYNEGLTAEDFERTEWTDGDYADAFDGWQEADEYIDGLDWYAVLMDKDDNDWGTGSRNRAEAFEMAAEMGAKYVATIVHKECVDIEEVG